MLVAGAVFVWGFFFLLGDPIGVGGDEVVVVMEDGAGLGRGSPIHLNGVQVGTVRGVKLSPPEGVLIRIKVDNRVRLPADTRALARTDVFGTNSVELIPGDALVSLDGGDTIQGIVQTPLTDLATELGGQARHILESTDSLLSPSAIANLRATASVLPDAAQELQAAFAQLSLAAASFRRTAEEMEGAQAGAATGAALADVQSSAQAATAALATMDLSLQSLTSVLNKIDRGEGTLGRLVNDTTLYTEFSATLREVRSLTADVRENPRRYVTVRVF